MKVGHFVSLGIGGADRAAYNLAIGLKSIGSAPVIFYSKNSIPSRTPDQDAELPLLNILSLYKGDFDLHQIEGVEDFNKFGLDILHTHQSGDAHWLLPGLENLERGFKIVETNFHGFQQTPADFRIFPSKSLMRWRRIRPSEDNQVIPNAILKPLSNDSYREDLGISPDTIVLGRLARADNSVFSANLLKTYQSIRGLGKVALVWVGASRQSRSISNDLGIKDVFWVDPVKEPESVSKWMNTFDIFCHFNKLGETFGNSVAEAMMHGLPIVSLAGTILYPQAQGEVLGQDSRIFYSRFSANRALARLIDQPFARQRLGDANKARAIQFFSPEAVAHQVTAIYERLLAKP
jgi:glycosyltransferase involved in cell wall biosynthesis